MHGYIQWFSTHITGDNTVISYAWVHLVVFYAYYWLKHGKQLCMGKFSGILTLIKVLAKHNLLNQNYCVIVNQLSWEILKVFVKYDLMLMPIYIPNTKYSIYLKYAQCAQAAYFQYILIFKNTFLVISTLDSSITFQGSELFQFLHLDIPMHSQSTQDLE